MFRSVLGAAALLAAVGCSATVQTSSGRGYLDRIETPAPSGAGFDADELQAAASVEPLLRFPAKLGLARIENGRLSSIPDAEMSAWADLVEQTGGAYGEFAPLNLLVAEMATPQRSDLGLSRTQNILRTVRLGAARQHMDAVLIYEVYGTANNRQNPLSVGDLTILGAYLLPGRSVEAVGHAEGLLFDVRNGYPYVSLSKSVDRDALATGARVRGRSDELKAQAMTKAVEGMVAELGPALEELASELPSDDGE